MAEIRRLKACENLLTEQDHNAFGLEKLNEDLKREINDWKDRYRELEVQNKIIHSKISENDLDSANAISLFEKDIETLKSELIGYCDLVNSQEECINSMK